MISRLKDIVDNEKGYVLVVSLLMLTVVTVIGIAATRTSDTELQIASNERQHLTDFYSAEGGVIYMLEDYTPWLTTAFLTAGETAASYGPVDIDIDSDGTNDATVEARYVEDSGTTVPVLPHTGSPPVGSGYSVEYFEVHRYLVTVTSITGNVQIESGAWKVFSKE